MELMKILQGLGSNDQSNRDNNLLELRKFLNRLPKINKTNKSELEQRKKMFARIWNCLFYCKNFLTLIYIFFSLFNIFFKIDFWNTDKQATQRRCADLIANLFDVTLHIEYFFLSALETFNSKWSKIDFLRLDKYAMLLDTLHQKFFSLKRVFNKPLVK